MVVSVTLPNGAGRRVPTSDAPATPSTAQYGELLRETRKQRWMIRAAIAVPVGGLLWALFNWRVGLIGLLIVVIADMVYRVKTHSSIAAWRKISSSERRTERQLYQLEAKGYRALHARAIPDSDAQIDHLVVGPTGIFSVDSENWDRHLPVRAYPNQLYVGPFSRNDRIREARWEADRAQELLIEALGFSIEVVPSLAIYGPKIPWKVLTVRGVDVFTGRRVRKWIRRRQPTLSPADVERILNAAVEVLPFKVEVETPN
ncbi:MAG: NERD domain-containing protein [Streptosporangiales bacterium]|nr:NERD domain-containing protein [Streptosporangiales bacterium]